MTVFLRYQSACWPYGNSETSNKLSGSAEFSARQLYFGAARPNVKLMNGADVLPADYVRNKHNTGTAVQYVGLKTGC